jgi:hypothetical protein
MDIGLVFIMGNRLKIAQVAPLYESVPPKLHVGAERVVSQLRKALVGLGHKATLYTSSDSITKAKLRPVCPRALRPNRICGAPLDHGQLHAALDDAGADGVDAAIPLRHAG